MLAKVKSMLRRAAPLIALLLAVALVRAIAWLFSRAIPVDPPDASRDAYLVAAGFGMGSIVVLVGAAHSMSDYAASGLFHGARLLLARLIGQLGQTEVIENGLTVQPKGNASGPLLGPRSVMLRSSVGIFYQGAKQTAVEGGTTYVSKPREYVRKAYDLNPKQRTHYFEPVLTADQMPVRIGVVTSAGIFVRSEVVQGTEPLNDEEKERITRLAVETPDIDELVFSVVEQTVRTEAARLNYADLAGPDALTVLGNRLEARTSRELNPHGLRMYHLTAISVRPIDAVLNVATTARAQSERDMLRAATWRDALRLLADGYASSRQIAEQWDQVDPALLRGLSAILKKFPELADTDVPAYLTESMARRTGDKSAADSRAPDKIPGRVDPKGPAPLSGTGAGPAEKTRGERGPGGSGLDGAEPAPDRG